MKQFWKWSVGMVAVAGAISLSGCKSGEETGGASNQAGAPGNVKIKLGLTTALTGGTATYGISTSRGIQMAIDEANAKGGVLGKQIDLKTEDNGGKPEQAITAVQKLISADDVLAVLGDVTSSNSLAIAPVCQNAKVPMVTPASTNPEVTKKGNYIFRTCFSDPFQGSICARFAAKNLKAKNVAVLIDNKSDYSRGLSKFFVDEFSKTGKIVATSYYTAGDSDFRPQLTTIKAKNPDLLFVPGYYAEVSAIALQARELGMKQPMLGGDAWDSPKLVEFGKDAVQGSYFSSHYSSESKDPRVQKFVADFKKKFKNETPDALAAIAYDAANIMLAAIEKSNATEVNQANRDKLRDALAATSKFPGVTGNITLNKDRDAIKPLVMLQVNGKKFTYVATVQP